MLYSFSLLLALVILAYEAQSFSPSKYSVSTVSQDCKRQQLSMKVGNDAFSRANRAARNAQAGDRVVELLMPLGLELDEDEEKNVYVKGIEKNSRAERTGMIFVGDRIAMASATFG